MYFVISGRSRCHILSDAEAGVAVCGAKINRGEILRFNQGETLTAITKDKPANIPLCKHCSGTCKHCAGIESDL